MLNLRDQFFVASPFEGIDIFGTALNQSSDSHCSLPIQETDRLRRCDFEIQLEIFYNTYMYIIYVYTLNNLVKAIHNPMMIISRMTLLSTS